MIQITKARDFENESAKWKGADRQNELGRTCEIVQEMLDYHNEQNNPSRAFKVWDPERP